MESKLNRIDDLIIKETTTQQNRQLIEYVKEIVCNFYGVEKAFVIKKTRMREIVKARQVSMYLLRKNTLISLAQIAETFNQSHCSVIYGTRQVENFLFYDKETKRHIEELKVLIDIKIKQLTNEDKIDKGFYYADLSDFVSCKMGDKMIILSGYTELELFEFRTVNNLTEEFKPHKNTGMYILEKTQDEQ